MLPALAVLDLGVLAYDIYKSFNKTEKVKKGFEVIKTSGSFIDVSKKVGSKASSKCYDVELYQSKDGVFKPRSCKSDSIASAIDVGFKLSSLGKFLLETLENAKKDSVSLSDPKDFVKKEEIDNASDGDKTLLSVLESNGQNLLKTLVPLSNNIASFALVHSVSMPVVADELRKIRESSVASSVAVSVLLSDIVKQLSSIAQLIDVSNIVKSEQIGQLSDLVQKLDKINDTLDTIHITIDSKSFQVNAPDVTVQNSLDFSDIKDVLDNHLGKVAEAKELEKDYYEFLKTPKKFDLFVDDVPEIAPREAIAMSESIKAHLNSQEASLTSDDLGLDDYDVDFDDLMNELFKFQGIVNDLKKINGDDGDGS